MAQTGRSRQARGSIGARGRWRRCLLAAVLAVGVLPVAALPAAAAPGACSVSAGTPAALPGGDLVARLVSTLLDVLGARRSVTVVCGTSGASEGAADRTSTSTEPTSEEPSGSVPSDGDAAGSPSTAGSPSAAGSDATPVPGGDPAAPSGGDPTAAPAPTSAPAAPAVTAARPDHIVVVVEENEDAESVLGSTKAPYLDSLAKEGASFTRFTAETHPSQPNYLALFSGDTHGVRGDECADPITAPNLASALTEGGRTFVGYSEGLPKAGFTGCTSGRYARKHAPWAAFAGTPAAQNQPWTAWPSDFTQLPDVAFVIPDLCHDMHDCSVTQGDAWLRDNLGDYATWARTHNSLLVVTWDEASTGSPDNRIATLVTGAGVRPGAVTESADHYRLLSTIAGLEGVPAPGRAGEVAPLTGWRSAG